MFNIHIMKKAVIIICGLLFLLILGLAGSYLWPKAKPKPIPMLKRGVELAGTVLHVDIADTALKQEKGLGGVEALSDSEGMLFVFDEPTSLSFWMKGMKIPIDIIWLKAGRVVDFIPNVQPEPGVPEADLKIYSPKEDADTVLEVAAGWSERHDLKVGDELVFQSE